MTSSPDSCGAEHEEDDQSFFERSIDESDVVWGEIHGDPRTDEVVTVTLPAPPKRALTAAEKSRRAVALKLGGASYQEIADKLGYADASGARSAVLRAMERHTAEDVQTLRQMHGERLETLLASVWPLVTRDMKRTKMEKDGEGYLVEVEVEDTETRFKAVDRALSVLDRIDKLNGLSAPSQSEHHVTHTQETVIVARGGEREYIEALEAAHTEKLPELEP